MWLSYHPVLNDCNYAYWHCTISPMVLPSNHRLPAPSLLFRECHISNKCSFRQEHTGVPCRSDSSEGTSYPLTENHTWPVTQMTGHVAYWPCGGSYTRSLILVTGPIVNYPVDARCPSVALPSLWVRNVAMYTHHQTDTCVTLFAAAPFSL